MCDAKLGASIKDKLNIACVHDEGIMELMRGLRSQIEELVTAATPAEMRSMAIGLAHSLSRYKLKFSPDKVDTMIVQVVGRGVGPPATLAASGPRAHSTGI